MSDGFYIALVLAVSGFLFAVGFCQGPHPAEARNLCQRPVHMMTTNCINRVPTPEMPYCKPTGY